MITLNHPFVTPTTNNLQKQFYDRDMIRALAVQLVGNQIEAHIDLINDAGPEEYKTFKEVDDCIHGAKESVKDYIEDMLADFRSTLTEELAKVKVETKSFIQKPGRDGRVDMDADVDVSIGE